MSHSLTSTQRSLIFINLIVTCIASCFLSTALVVALAPICNELQVSVSSGQWLTSAFSLVSAIIMPLTAFLITTIRTKRLYLSGMGFLLAGLFVCIISHSFLFVMVGRVLQAIGSGIVGAMGQVVLLSIYPRDKHGSIMGWYGLAMGFAPVVAPTISGIIIDLSGWRMIFTVTLILTAFSFLFACVVFKDIIPVSKKQFDLLSFLLSGLAFGGITLGVGNLSNYGIHSIAAILPLLIGVVSMFFFATRQLHQDNPFLNIRVLKNRTFLLSAISGTILFFIMMGSSTIVPLYAQSVMGLSATVAGLVLLPGSIVNAFASPIAGKIYDKQGMKRLYIVTAVLLLLSNVMTLFIGEASGPAFLAITHMIRCMACGALMMPFVSWGMKELSPAMTPHGTAMLTTLRSIGGALGTAVLVGVMTTMTQFAPVDTNSAVFGARASYALLTLLSGILLFIALFLVKDTQE